MCKTLKPRTPRTKSPEQALSSLMSLCARAEKSSGDALRLMRGWGVESSAQAQVLEKLKESKFIDDRRYAEAFLREKSRMNGWGEHKIRLELGRKKIDREIIDEVISTIDKEQTKGRLEELLQRKMRSTKSSSPFDLRAKLIRFGLSRGHDYSQVRECVERLVDVDDFE